MSESFTGPSNVRNPAALGPAGNLPRMAPAIDTMTAVPEGVALIWPVYLVAGSIVAGAAFLYGGIELTSVAIAVIIAVWALIEPRTALWLCTAYMIFIFVFFQTDAPLGEEVPEEFFYWGVGIALITTGLLAATLFSSKVDWAVARSRLNSGISIAMFVMLLVILAATVYGLLAGNQVFAVVRQLFGCLLLPVYYFLGIVLFGSRADVELWLRRVSWVVALGSGWYVARLSLISFAQGMYYREQSPLVAYSGAISILALSQLISRRQIKIWIQALAQISLCLLAILLMGSRATLGSFLTAAVVVALLAVWRRRVLVVVLASCLLPIGMGLAPYVITSLVESRGMVGYVADRFIFVLADDNSYQGRVAQTEVVMNMVEKQPILGAGMGSENTFIMPGAQRRVKVASVDNGWGYLLLKMGYVGLVAFLLLIALVLRRGLSGLHASRSPALRTNRLALIGVFLYALVSFLGGPTFFHFSVSPFFATALGALAVLGDSRALAANVPSQAADISAAQQKDNAACWN